MNSNVKMEFPRSVLAVFAKQPQRGRVKTRLQPVIGEDAALSLHKALIQFVFCNLQKAGLCPAEFWVAMPEALEYSDKALDEVFLSICNIKDIHIQEGADLGARMADCARTVLQRADQVVLVGADCPSVDADYLRRALTHLDAGADIVIGPAEDGGYVLLGLRKVPECLFRDIPWGSADVLAATRARLQKEGLAWVELEPRWDVDRPEDLARWQALL